MRDQAPCPRLWATQDSKTGMECMKETILRSGIDRRILLSTLALLPALSGRRPGPFRAEHCPRGMRDPPNK